MLNLIEGKTIGRVTAIGMNANLPLSLGALQIDFTDGTFIILSPRQIDNHRDVKIVLMDKGTVTELNAN